MSANSKQYFFTEAGHTFRVDEIREFRKRLHGYALLCSRLDQEGYFTSRATESILLAKAWLGDAIGSVLRRYDSNDKGYSKDGQRYGIDDVEPTKEAWDNPAWSEITNKSIKEIDPSLDVKGHTDNQVIKIDSMREKIKEELPNCDWNHDYEDYDDWKQDYDVIMALRYAKHHLKEARFQLGLELAELREGYDQYVKMNEDSQNAQNNGNI